MQQPTDIFHDNPIKNVKRRRALLPGWIKIFIWLFLLFGAIAPIAFVIGLSGYKFQIALYGLETNEPLSMTGQFLLYLFLFKGIVAYGLWTEKNWAVYLAILDASLGIAISVFMMVIYPLIDDVPQFILNIRLELLVLVPYLIKMTKIEKQWKLFILSDENMC